MASTLTASIQFTLAAAAILTGTAAMVQSDIRLQGAGATFPNPLYQRWVAEYQKTNPHVKIDYQSIGSGGGIKGITEKTIDFAGSDAPMTRKEIADAGGASNLIEIPSCAGAVVPAYNLPDVKGEVKFTGDILADIYLGTITTWNDPRLAAINPDLTLPSTPIVPAWRTDGSGTTFIWTSYLCTQSDKFKSTIGAGKQVKWPVGQGGKGNEGVAAAVQQTPGALGYIEQNYAEQNKIPFGAVKNKDGKFVKASAQTVSAAGDAGAASMEGQNLLAASIWNQPGPDSYPIASFTYLILYKDLNNVKSREQAQALVDYLWWATHEGQHLAGALGYAPLGKAVQAKVETALKSLTFKNAPVTPSAK